MDFVITLFLLILLQAVLGFDNLLYIALESKRVPVEKQSFVRRMGIGVAVGLRIVLLFFIVNLIQKFEKPFFGLHFGAETGETYKSHVHHDEVLPIHKFIDGDFNLHAIIVLFGGAFILYTATKEIFHMLSTHDLNAQTEKPRSVGMTIFWIVLMNLVFSFDSILSAMALAKDAETGDPNFLLMAIAIIVGGVLMIVLSDKVANFLQKNRMYEVLGLFVLFVVGIMLLTEGGHLSDLHFFGNAITPMTKTTFYFVIGVLVVTDIVQSRYQKKLLAQQEHNSISHKA